MPIASLPLQPGSRPKATRYFNEGVQLQQQRNLGAAISSYGKAIATDPSFAQSYYNLAIAYRDARQFDNALDNYELALLANPNFTDARYNYALLLQEQGYTDDAIAQYEKILEGNYNEVSAHLSVAALYARNPATLPKAREHYQTYLKLSPQSPFARNIRRWLDQNK